MTSKGSGKNCPICLGTGNLGVNVRRLNCLGTGLTDTESLYKSPISCKVVARHGPRSVT
jgi:hypothetical protein